MSMASAASAPCLHPTCALAVISLLLACVVVSAITRACYERARDSVNVQCSIREEKWQEVSESQPADGGSAAHTDDWDRGRSPC